MSNLASPPQSHLISQHFRFACFVIAMLFLNLSLIFAPSLLAPTVTFEDKKRENFERGNLELEKRRQALLEQQRKEQERLAALEREEQERKVKKIH